MDAIVTCLRLQWQLSSVWDSATSQTLFTRFASVFEPGSIRGRLIEVPPFCRQRKWDSGPFRGSLGQSQDSNPGCRIQNPVLQIVSRQTQPFPSNWLLMKTTLPKYSVGRDLNFSHYFSLPLQFSHCHLHPHPCTILSPEMNSYMTPAWQYPLVLTAQRMSWRTF